MKRKSNTKQGKHLARQSDRDFARDLALRSLQNRTHDAVGKERTLPPIDEAALAAHLGYFAAHGTFDHFPEAKARRMLAESICRREFEALKAKYGSEGAISEIAARSGLGERTIRGIAYPKK